MYINNSILIAKDAKQFTITRNSDVKQTIEKIERSINIVQILALGIGHFGNGDLLGCPLGFKRLDQYLQFET